MLESRCAMQKKAKCNIHVLERYLINVAHDDFQTGNPHIIRCASVDLEASCQAMALNYASF